MAVSAEQALRRWSDPAVFASEVLGINPWAGIKGDGQLELLHAARDYPRVAVRSGHKIGKALAPETLVPTPRGWRRHGDLRVGDELFADDGSVCRVTKVTAWHRRPVLRVRFEDGTFIDADPRHEWVVRTRETRKRTFKGTVLLETEEMAARCLVPNGPGRSIPNFTVDLPGPIDLPRADLPLDPYLLGLWLGDGTSASGGFTGIDGLWQAFKAAGFPVSTPTQARQYVSGLVPLLRSIGVLNRKHIPEPYLWASADQRLALLQGLMDTDGTISPSGRAQFCNTRHALAAGVLQLARSLGLKARIKEGRAMLRGRDVGPKWTVEWASPVPTVRLPRKLARIRKTWQRKASAHSRMAITRIERLPGLRTLHCLEVDSPSHLYLCGESMLPTHNSTSAAIIGLCWVCTRWRGRVVMTSASNRQVGEILWREVKLMYERAAARGCPLGGRILSSPAGGLRFPDGRELVGYTTDNPERMGGTSGHNLLYLIDEASGVPEPIFEAIEGNRAGGARVVMFGNPTRPTGTFFDAFHTKRNFWKTLHISSETTPNAVHGRMLVPGLALREWVRERREEWGEDSPLYQVRVRGNFAAQADNTVIGLALIEAGAEGWEPDAAAKAGPADGPLDVGVDPAEFGDDETVTRAVRGKVALEEDIASGMDAVEVAGRVMGLVNRHRHPDDQRKPHVKIDGIGVGSGVYAILRRERSIVAHCVKVSESPTANNDTEEVPRFGNLRAQLWTGLADWLRAGGTFQTNPKLEAEMAAPTYTFNTRGSLMVEPKDNIKKRLGRSPDRAEALMLAVYRPPDIDWLDAMTKR